MQEVVPRHSHGTHEVKQNAKKSSDRIVLCIGGRILQTSKQTLCMDADSMLAAWVLRHLPHESHENEEFRFNGNHTCLSDRSSGDRIEHANADAVPYLTGDDNCLSVHRSNTGHEYDDGDSPVLWIDRDGRRFDHVLNYLRNGTIWLDDVASLRAVQEEAVFFGLSGLQALCEERIQALENLKSQHSKEIQQAIRGAITDFCKDHLASANAGSKGEVVAILHARRLGVADTSNRPVFQLDEDF